MTWLLLAVIAAGLAYLVYERRATLMKAPTMTEATHTQLVRLLWIGLSVAALGFALRGIGELVVASSAAAQGLERAYTTSNPATTEWLGLATKTGRYTILLGDGCDGIGPDMNVLADTSDDGNWTLQLEGSDQVCSVVEWHWQGNTPCFTNDAGECDVARA